MRLNLQWLHKHYRERNTSISLKKIIKPQGRNIKEKKTDKLCKTQNER